ncbi:metallo-beta-lactamase domain-containing protein 1 [Pieris napi]|uniref:metallo-beta-lactamase domain-containing protein 1 n=1 Tax=Pieris napi TaxID=78633 RepID=UPI001FBA5F19|nr:metallo-beta-lactamase domain-containing protein 1 [Pieris napi]
MCEVTVLQDGYSYQNSSSEMIANCTCSLITGVHNIIVDTMTPWDSEKILQSLEKHNLTCEKINYVISTHGHSDHTGNNNLFLKATHIVGWSISFKDKYYIHPFEKGNEFIVNEFVKVVPTPGHTMSDVTVLVKSKDEIVAIVGDLFEKHEDIMNQNIWMSVGSEDPIQQAKNRAKIADAADWIIPGHGPMFKVTNEIRTVLRNQSS